MMNFNAKDDRQIENAHKIELNDFWTLKWNIYFSKSEITSSLTGCNSEIEI